MAKVLLRFVDLSTKFGNYRVNLDQGGSSNYIRVKRDNDCRMISWYAQDTGATAAAQLNAEGVEYRHMYAGYYDDSYGPVDRLITASGTFVIEKTGKYYIELYGGGGKGYTSNAISSGGSSCQSYSGVQLNKGEAINVVIGAANGGTTGGTTSFGSFSVAGGGNASRSGAGTGSGNLGKDGVSMAIPSKPETGTIVANTVSDGIYGAEYGYGGGIEYRAHEYKGLDGGAGAVFIRYEGQ